MFHEFARATGSFVAICDCSRRGDNVPDGFGGWDRTLTVAENGGRSARLIEFDPLYVDVIVRFEQLTGKHATLIESGQTFEDFEPERSGLIGVSGSCARRYRRGSVQVAAGRVPLAKGQSGSPKGRPRKARAPAPQRGKRFRARCRPGAARGGLPAGANPWGRLGGDAAGTARGVSIGNGRGEDRFARKVLADSVQDAKTRRSPNWPSRVEKSQQVPATFRQFIVLFGLILKVLNAVVFRTSQISSVRAGGRKASWAPPRVNWSDSIGHHHPFP